MDSIEQAIGGKSWAVVGANNNHDKFGCKIFKYLERSGKYKVYPVNPGLDEVQGQKCYASVKDLPEKPDAVNVVVPPRAGEQVLRDCAEAGIKTVWLQPGADTDAVVKMGRQLGLDVICACVLVEGRRRGISG
ncbi:MAG: CoA-binding protein [Negativicutes bacterium]|nr:CoA-binding protein [Negativicutes bacterium]